MKIAICDDIGSSRDAIYEILKKCNALIPDAPIAQFASGKELIGHYQERGGQDGFDLIFMDIEMPGFTGLETGHELRKTDKNVMIVYLTDYAHFMRQSFKVEVFDFLVKPPNFDEVKDVLVRASKKYRELHHIVDIKWKGGVTKRKASEIVYLWGYYKRVAFYTEDENYQCTGTLKDYETLLAPHGFLKCHKNYVVNMKYIKTVEHNKVLLTTGTQIDMSVRMKNDCLQKLNEFYLRYEI